MTNGFQSEIGNVEYFAQIQKVMGNVNVLVSTAADGTKHAVPFLAPPANEHPIVGREQLLAEVKQALLKGHSQALVVLPGVGKTALALALAKEMAEELAARKGDLFERFCDGLLWAHLGRSPNTREELRRWAYALKIQEAEMAHLASPEDWSRAVADAIGTRRMLIVIDAVWSANDARPFLLGTNCPRLITTRLPGVAVELLSVAAKVSVDKLTEDDGLMVLKHFALNAVSGEPDAARQLVRDVDGLPLALILMGKRLKVESYSGQVGRIKDVVKELADARVRFSLEDEESEDSGKTPRSLSAVIEMSYEALDDVRGKGLDKKHFQALSEAQRQALGEVRRQALRALSIFRADPNTFPEDLALLVSGASRTTLDELEDTGLVESRPPEDYTMHRTIAEYVREKLAPEKFKELHHRAVDYYRERLNALEEKQQSDPNAYLNWYRYEKLEWQETKNHWLYHLAHAGDDLQVAIAFLRAYFDAFWWWGCYLDKGSFCGRLLSEWQQRQTSLEAAKGLRLVKDFQDAYPKETEDRRKGNWSQVESALRELRRSVNLDGDPSELTDHDRRHVRGLTDIFLAEVYRFGRDDRDQAAKWYQEAYEQFEKNDDDWDKAWTLYHFADLNYERGRSDEALKQCSVSLLLGMSEEDPEVIANVYRLQGDISLSRRDFDGATENYQRAVFHAYRFQAIPSPPDPYTVEFYSQMVERTLARLSDIHSDEEAKALSFCAAMHELWLPYWERVGVPVAVPNLETLLKENARIEELKAYLFPRELKAEELSSLGAAYGAEVAAVVNELNRDRSL